VEVVCEERIGDRPTGRANDRVTVVIPDYGRSPFISQNIAALLAGTRAPDEVIVSHSGPHDPTARLKAEFPQVLVLHSDERMLGGAARNRGAEVARGEWIAFLDSDVCPSETWLEAMLASANGGNRERFVVGSVGYQTTGGYWGLCLWLSEFSEMLPHLPSREQVGGASCNMLVKKQDFLSAGTFPTEFQPGEDTVLFARLREIGRQQWFASQAVVRHYNLPGFHRYLRHQMNLGRWSAIVRRSFALQGAWLVRFWPLAPFAWIARLALFTKRICRGGAGTIALFFLLLPGILVGLIIWNAGFLNGLAGQDRIAGGEYGPPRSSVG
jgi:GT2 family glycosyltransferase